MAPRQCRQHAESAPYHPRAVHAGAFVSPMTRRIGPLRAAPIAISSALLVMCVTYACGGGGNDVTTQPPSPPSPPEVPSAPSLDLSALRIISGDQQTDTISAVLPQVLVVEVHDSTGGLAAGRPVRFTAFGNLDVAPLGLQNWNFSNTIPTDATGRARIQVKLGATAGTANLAIAVASLGLSSTASYTLLRGAPAKFEFSPRDTAVSPGGSYTLNVMQITDRGGTPLPGLVPTFSASGAVVTSSGQVTVPNTAPQRAKIVVSYQQASDTAKVSVYPRLPMIFARHDMVRSDGSGPGSTVVLINSDGTGSTDVARTSDESLSPSSVTSTSSVVYYRGDPSSNSKVWVVQPNGAPRLLLPGETRREAWPRLSPDGMWVYFVRDEKSLWRVKLDGTGLDSLTPSGLTRLRPSRRTVAPSRSMTTMASKSSTWPRKRRASCRSRACILVIHPTASTSRVRRRANCPSSAAMGPVVAPWLPSASTMGRTACRASTGLLMASGCW
jgi:hypothetical protein